MEAKIRTAWCCVALLVAGACGPANVEGLPEERLQLTSVDPITLTQGQEVIAVLSVFYDGKEPLSYSAEDLPPFAVLEGNRLTLKPTSLADTGDFLITLRVTDGHKTDSADLRIHVDRLFHAPGIRLVIQNGASIHRYTDAYWFCFDECYTTDGTFAHFEVSDMDGDPVRIELEVVAEDAEGQPGRPFTGEATFASEPIPVSGSRPGGRARVYFSGPQVPTEPNVWGGYSTFFIKPLPAGKWYHGRYRAKDASGSTTEWKDLYRFFVFDRQP